MRTDNQRDVLFDNFEQTDSNSKKSYYQLKSLQARGNYRQFLIHFCRLFHYLKRASLRLSVGIKGSVSVEASVAIPIFLFAFLEIMSLFQYISVYSGVLQAIKSTGDSLCVYGYMYDLVTDDMKEVSIGEKIISSVIFSEGYLDAQIRSQCRKEIYHNTIQNGVRGISLLGTYLDRERTELSITARYTMEPICSFTGTDFPVICRYYGKWWTGYLIGEQRETEEYVYITENGSVYHLSQSCTHLNLSIISVDKSDLGGKRNDSGGKYGACSLCCNIGYMGSTYYITESGDRYHEKLSCSGLKRTVYRVTRLEVEDWAICSRCEKNNKKQEES